MTLILENSFRVFWYVKLTLSFFVRYESWDDPEVPKFHYGSHYSSAGIVLFYLLRLPPFSIENQKLQGGQFDHADRLFNSVRDTWLSAAGKGNTSDVKELIPEFFYMPEFLENRFNLDLGEKQSGEKVILLRYILANLSLQEPKCRFNSSILNPRGVSFRLGKLFYLHGRKAVLDSSLISIGKLLNLPMSQKICITG